MSVCLDICMLLFCAYSHLTCIFSPHVIFSPCMLLSNSTAQSHLMSILCAYSPLAYIFSSHVLPSTSTTQSHLVSTSHAHSHLAYIFSSHVLPSISTAQSHLASTSYAYSHVTYIFLPCMPFSTQNNIFHLTCKKFPKKSCNNPNSINKVPLTSHQISKLQTSH